MISKFRISAVAMAAMLTLGVVAPLRAGGTTIDDKKAQAAELEAEIEANGEKVAALSEQYNGAVLDYESSKSEVAQAESRLADAEKQHSELSSLVAARGAVLYLGAQDPSSLLPDTNIASVNELGARTKYGAVATGNDQQLIANLDRAEQDLTSRRKFYDRKVSDAAKKRDFIAATRQSVEEANSRAEELLSQVKGEIATLIQQEKERKQAELQARLTALANAASNQGNGASRVPSASVGGDAIPNLPAPSARAATAIAYAEAQLGKPYEYAASGPNTYDCSGLTMMAWASAGVSMPHYSGAQYAMFPHVPLDQLQPGDLLFWGAGGSEHVAMYIGGGLQIAATHTGDYVRIQPEGSNPVGAARPG
jgi:cell wall-associated NlpC family hydrolase